MTLEKYAELCALMADTGGDIEKENSIAQKEGVSPVDWKEAKEYYTALMQDPSDMGRTAMAFMPLFQAAQAGIRGGGEPGSLEQYTKVHAEMALRKDPGDPSKKNRSYDRYRRERVHSCRVAGDGRLLDTTSGIG